MGIEIERKFLVSGEAWRAVTERSEDMAQGYLNDQEAVASGRERASVRVRLEGGRARLNIKSRAVGHTRQEFEYPLPVDDAEALLALCAGGLVRKRRHFVREGGWLWEVDEFLGANAGLVVAEIELPAADAAFARPDWLGPEVTDCLRYYNQVLSARPYAQWSEDERMATDIAPDRAAPG